MLLYLARTHYEAEQWQDCKRTLLRAIHLAPSNYTLRFDTGVSLQKFSASTLQKTKRTVDEVLPFYVPSYVSLFAFKYILHTLLWLNPGCCECFISSFVILMLWFKMFPESTLLHCKNMDSTALRY